MCGICFLLGPSPINHSTLDKCLQGLRRRGPNASGSKLVDLKDKGALHLMAAVLHLRGNNIFTQPAEDPEGNILLWNGEVFEGLAMEHSESDTFKVLTLLSSAESDHEVVSSLASISGPFAFVYFSSRRQTIYYGRDPIGRRSLLVRTPRTEGEPLFVSSCVPDLQDLRKPCDSKTPRRVKHVDPHGASISGPGVAHLDAEHAGDGSPGGEYPRRSEPVSGGADAGAGAWEEVCADGVYSLQLDLSQQGMDGARWSIPTTTLHPWSLAKGDGGSSSAARISSLAHHAQDQGQENNVRGCRDKDGQHVAPMERASAAMGPTRQITAEASNASSLPGGSMDVSQGALGLLSALRASIRRRVCTIPCHSTHATTCAQGADGIPAGREHGPQPKDPMEREHGNESTSRRGHAVNASRLSGGPVSHRIVSGDRDGDIHVAARVGVLFSGGLDSVVVAAMLAETGVNEEAPAVPEGEAIDLINVCFDSPTGHSSPDRLASIAATAELQALFPKYLWRLICVDASYEDVLQTATAVSHLMQPCSTAMDFNIAAAFWFAARGVGRLYQPPLMPSPAARATTSGRMRGAQVCDVDASPEVTPTCIQEPKTLKPSSLPHEMGVLQRERTSTITTGVARDVKENGVSKSMRTRELSSGESKSRGDGYGEKDMVPRIPKVNKNMEELCPVDGCRHLLKPDCVIGTCSRCCSRIQQLVVRADPYPIRGVAAVGTDASHHAVDCEQSQGILKEQRTEHEHVEQQDQERVFKARAVAQAAQALENHVMAHFKELTRPFRANQLGSLLRTRAGIRPVKAGRDLHSCSHRALLPTPCTYTSPSEMGRDWSTLQSIKLCPVHKNAPVGKVGHGSRTREAGMDSVDSKEGCEFHEAAGSGKLFRSEAKVLLVGIGADELMGGYSRHRNAYKRNGTEGLREELLKDQGRLWRRNLGRDDRCIADHGREARFPFLDEGVVAYLRSLALHDICDMEEPPGFGDKKILRQVAAHLGLDSCRTLPKRAIQFGTRIAQHCARHTHGSHRRGKGSDPAFFDSNGD